MGKRYILAFVATLFLIGLNSSCRNSSGSIPMAATPTALYISESENIVSVSPIPKEEIGDIDSVQEIRGSLPTVTSVPIKSSKEADSKQTGVYFSPTSIPTIVPTDLQPSGQGLGNRIVPTPTPSDESPVIPTRPEFGRKVDNTPITTPSNKKDSLSSVKTSVHKTTPISIKSGPSPAPNVKKLVPTSVPSKPTTNPSTATPTQPTPTPNLTTATPTQPTPISNPPTPTPTQPMPTPNPPTATPTQPTPTLDPPSTAANTPTPTLSLPTATPNPPTPTPTPEPLTGDPRFGLVAHTDSRAETRYLLEELGVNWYLNFSSTLDKIPNGANKVAFIQVPGDSLYWNSGAVQSIGNITDNQRLEMGFTTRGEVEYMASMAPGSYWYIFGEPNRYGFITPERFISVYHYYVTTIKSYDPSAKIIGTSMLNWDHTCIGCSGTFQCESVPRKGYMCGKVWFKRFVAAYELEYGYKPTVDAWGIDLYPLDWSTFGANSEIHASIVISQLVGMRAYLDTLQEYLETPLWITEIAVHRGYDCGPNCRSWAVDPSGNGLLPVGVYRWDKMSDFMLTVLDWLEVNATAYKIEKWFFFVSWRDIVSASTDGYMGIIFFDGPTPSAGLNCLGDAYRSRALQYLTEPPVRLKCGESGLSFTE